jgi:uncharacterized protein (DUF2141 family)/uncharacterized membrane protein
MHLTFIGWLHALACVVALTIGGLVLWRAKGGATHRRDGQRYLCAMVVVNLTALGIYRIGSFNVFHILALCTLASLAIAFASARWRKPQRHWLRIHLSAVVFSYYQLVGGLINEAFVRVPALQGERALAGLTQGVAMMVFLMILSYFWGRTARHGAAAMAVLAGTVLAGAAQAGTLTLDVAGVAVGKGPLVVAVYDNGKDFLRKPVRTLKASATGASTQVALPDMAPGEHAVAIYQDINDNGKMDTRLFGIPAEPTGMSNNAPSNFGPPKYDAARFTMPADDKTLAIGLHK